MRAYEKEPVWKLALDLLSQQAAGESSTFDSYNAAISACDKASAWALALVMLSPRQVTGASAAVNSGNAAGSACEKASEWTLAIDLLVQQAAEGDMQRAPISACEQASEWKLALDLLPKRQAAGVTPSVKCVHWDDSSISSHGEWVHRRCMRRLGMVWVKSRGSGKGLLCDMWRSVVEEEVYSLVCGYNT